MEKKITSNVTKGLIISLVIIILSLAFYFLGFSFEGWTQYVIYAIFIGGIIWSCHIYGQELDHEVTFGNTFAHGFKVTAVVAIIMVAYVLIFSAIVPEMKDQTLQIMRSKMAENPKVTQQMIDQTVEMYMKWFTPIMIAGALFGYVFMGLIASLIGAALTKKNPPSFQHQA